MWRLLKSTPARVFRQTCVSVCVYAQFDAFKMIVCVCVCASTFMFHAVNRRCETTRWRSRSDFQHHRRFVSMETTIAVTAKSIVWGLILVLTPEYNRWYSGLVCWDVDSSLLTVTTTQGPTVQTEHRMAMFGPSESTTQTSWQISMIWVTSGCLRDVGTFEHMQPEKHRSSLRNRVTSLVPLLSEFHQRWWLFRVHLQAGEQLQSKHQQQKADKKTKAKHLK